MKGQVNFYGHEEQETCKTTSVEQTWEANSATTLANIGDTHIAEADRTRGQDRHQVLGERAKLL